MSNNEQSNTFLFLYATLWLCFKMYRNLIYVSTFYFSRRLPHENIFKSEKPENKIFNEISIVSIEPEWMVKCSRLFHSLLSCVKITIFFVCQQYVYVCAAFSEHGGDGGLRCMYACVHGDRPSNAVAHFSLVYVCVWCKRTRCNLSLITPTTIALYVVHPNRYTCSVYCPFWPDKK